MSEKKGFRERGWQRRKRMYADTQMAETFLEEKRSGKEER